MVDPLPPAREDCIAPAEGKNSWAPRASASRDVPAPRSRAAKQKEVRYGEMCGIVHECCMVGGSAPGAAPGRKREEGGLKLTAYPRRSVPTPSRT
eukprot:6538735-Pyramimonas_sp.AAC.1